MGVCARYGGRGMNSFTNSFNEKAGKLAEVIFGACDGKTAEDFGREHAPMLVGGRFAAFISVCDTRERARVFRAASDSPADAWNMAKSAAERYVAAHDFNPMWVKADITAKSEHAPFEEVQKQAVEGYHEFFRRGIAFDDALDTALIEAEINGNRVISYKEKKIDIIKVNKHLASCGLKTLSGMPETLVLFDCESAFCNENGSVYRLYGEGNDCGRRVLQKMDKETALRVISTSSEYLSMMVGLDGKFDYGYYPIFHKEIPGYNILRHATSIWSLLCAYRVTGDKFLLRQTESAIGYMISNTFYKYNAAEDAENTVYLADKTKNEVKIGGNGVAIVMLTEYMNVTGSDKFKKLCVDLGNGILELFDSRTGEFFHVLNYPNLAPKDKFRTVYYDGECVFALCRLYGLTKQRRFLDTAAMAVDRFIKNDYTKHRDHWVAYAVNELTKYLPEDKYLSFGLKNANVSLKRIYNQPTTYHTYLELLCVTFELYMRIKKQGLQCGYLKKFDEEFFVKTIFRRAEYMLNGYGYPEYVMYFKYPESALGAFFVRHDGYRIRIDDIQHFCGAYYSFYRNYGELDELRRAYEDNAVNNGKGIDDI